VYTSALFVPAARPLPAATPVALAALLATAAMLSVAHVVPVGLHAEGWWGSAWVGAAAAFALASVRARRPGVRGRWPAMLLLAAAVATSAFLIRRADPAFVEAIHILPTSAAVLGPLDASEILMGLVLIGPAAAVSTRSSIRGPRPGLLIPALLALGWLGWVLFEAGPALPSPGALWVPGVLKWAVPLMWTAVLVGPGALPLSEGRGRAIAPWLAAVLGVLLLLVLGGTLAPTGRPFPTGVVVLSTVGRAMGLPYGAGVQVAAGAQAVVLVLAAQAVLVLAVRAASRNLPAAGPRTPLLLAIVAWTAALWCTEAALLVASGVLGWATACVGVGDGLPETSA